MSDHRKLVLDAGAFQMAINVLERAGKADIVEQLQKDVEQLPDYHQNALQEAKLEAVRDFTETAKTLIENGDYDKLARRMYHKINGGIRNQTVTIDSDPVYVGICAIGDYITGNISNPSK